jgi:glutathione synthase/RimK-type ligase-like ATP-grasp enzyme
VKVAILVPAPDFREAWDWTFDVEAGALGAHGFEVDSRPWTDVGDLGGFDAVLPLVAWGYHARYADWLALLDRLDSMGVPTVNPTPLLRWNGDKSYLIELVDAGVPTVPTRIAQCLDEGDLDAARAAFGTDILVVKPAISASADGAHKLGPGDPLPADARGRRMLVQPWMASVTTAGEYSLMLFGGTVSHCIVKRPKTGDFRVQPHLGGSEVPCTPPPGAEALARAALAAAPAEAAYARVDMIEDSAGGLRIMELELIEPALWLQHSPDQGAAFASAIRRAIEQPLP